MFPWKQSQSLTFLGCRQSCRRRRWSPCCLSSPDSGCRMPGLHSVATGDAGWSDALWGTDLCGRSDCQKLTVPPTDRTPVLHQLGCVAGLTQTDLGPKQCSFIEKNRLLIQTYLSSAGPGASWSLRPTGETCLSEPTATPAQKKMIK